MIEPIRLLAFAFAGADLLFEIDRDGVILFATGAPSSFSKNAEIAGTEAADLFMAPERPQVLTIVRGMSPGDRSGPHQLMLASGEIAALSLCYLPESDRISCTLVKPGKRGGFADANDPATGLADRSAFVAAMRAAGGADNVALVNAPNLHKLSAELAPDANSRLMKDLGSAIKAIGATVAARLSPTGFGAIGREANLAKKLSQAVRQAGHRHGIEGLETKETQLSLANSKLTSEQRISALRHVVDRFAQGTLPVGSTDVGDVFEQMMGETIARAMSFNETVADGAFDLSYESIVELKTGAVRHYEALTRFNAGESPAETIRFAEDMGLADSFDFAVAVKAISEIEANPAISAAIAINVSGRTLQSGPSFAMLAGLFAKKHNILANRILIEITESAAITDMAEADKAIQQLRKMGYKVGIDDFGAGAASLSYLHGFTIDFVKVDGTLIEALGQSPRAGALLRSIVASCRELKIETIAEWIDSAEKLRHCIEIGFDCGQGRRFGPALTNLAQAKEAGVPARRGSVGRLSRSALTR